jgi:glycosyltransferase involved in cell wall biosynthesis
MRPKVSICVPNLNTLPFLPERFETIFSQTFRDWELLVYDSYSTDGAWEYISKLAAGDSRIRAWQGPREGTPGSWTPCVREASGEYVYIATSDDTMPPDCLEHLVAALEAYPECALAHCNLRAIDENGNLTPDWWSKCSVFAQSSGNLLTRPHIRRAPFDGLLHLAGEPVYISITQLLVRRSLFDRIGFFESRWGGVGDFEWNMRAGLSANTIHVPSTWGGWRVHADQATAGAAIGSAEHFDKIGSMIEHVLANCHELLPPDLRRLLITRWAPRSKELRLFLREVATRQNNKVERRAFIVRKLLSGSPAALGYALSRLPGHIPWPESVPELFRRWLSDAGVTEVLVPVKWEAFSQRRDLCEKEA